MTTLREYRCEVCGILTSNRIHWFVIRCADSDLTVHRWNFEVAHAAASRQFCGEAHAQIYISRWFEPICSPPRQNFNRATPDPQI